MVEESHHLIDEIFSIFNDKSNKQIDLHNLIIKLNTTYLELFLSCCKYVSSSVPFHVSKNALDLLILLIKEPISIIFKDILPTKLEEFHVIFLDQIISLLSKIKGIFLTDEANASDQNGFHQHLISVFLNYVFANEHVFACKSNSFEKFLKRLFIRGDVDVLFGYFYKTECLHETGISFLRHLRENELIWLMGKGLSLGGLNECHFKNDFCKYLALFSPFLMCGKSLAKLLTNLSSTLLGDSLMKTVGELKMLINCDNGRLIDDCWEEMLDLWGTPSFSCSLLSQREHNCNFLLPSILRFLISGIVVVKCLMLLFDSKQTKRLSSDQFNIFSNGISSHLSSSNKEYQIIAMVFAEVVVAHQEMTSLSFDLGSASLDKETQEFVMRWRNCLVDDSNPLFAFHNKDVINLEDKKSENSKESPNQPSIEEVQLELKKMKIKPPRFLSEFIDYLVKNKNFTTVEATFLFLPKYIEASNDAEFNDYGGQILALIFHLKNEFEFDNFDPLKMDILIKFLHRGHLITSNYITSQLYSRSLSDGERIYSLDIYVEYLRRFLSSATQTPKDHSHDYKSALQNYSPSKTRFISLTSLLIKQKKKHEDSSSLSTVHFKRFNQSILGIFMGLLRGFPISNSFSKLFLERLMFCLAYYLLNLKNSPDIESLLNEFVVFGKDFMLNSLTSSFVELQTKKIVLLCHYAVFCVIPPFSVQKPEWICYISRVCDNIDEFLNEQTRNGSGRIDDDEIRQLAASCLSIITTHLSD